MHPMFVELFIKTDDDEMAYEEDRRRRARRARRSQARAVTRTSARAGADGRGGPGLGRTLKTP